MGPARGEKTEGRAPQEPSLDQVADALARHAPGGVVRPGVAADLAAERGWRGRLIEVLGALTEDTTRIGYVAGGHRPEELAAWLPVWAASPFSLDEIRTILAAAGWDPEPFVAVVRAGLLHRLLYRPDGALRRVRGELAGAWLSDQFALAGDEEILAAVRGLVGA